MKPKNTFVVEVKKSRRLDGSRKKRSLWAGIDLDDTKRQDTEGFEPAPVRPQDPAGDIEASDPEPAKPVQPRILPVIVEPVAPETHTPVATTPEAVPADAPDAPVTDDPGACRLQRRRRRQPRLRHRFPTPLPAGQRWKYRLPRILQKPD